MDIRFHSVDSVKTFSLVHPGVHLDKPTSSAKHLVFRWPNIRSPETLNGIALFRRGFWATSAMFLYICLAATGVCRCEDTQCCICTTGRTFSTPPPHSQAWNGGWTKRLNG